MIKKILQAGGAIAGATVLAIVVLIVALFAYQTYAGNKAFKAARTFCSRTPLGSDISLAIARAAGVQHMHNVFSGTVGLKIEFQGGIHHVAVCYIETSSNKVISVRTLSEDR